MAKQQRAALVFAGPVSRGSLIRLPGLRAQLTWVKSSSIATASRAVYALRCGTAVRNYSDLDGASLILISVPDTAVADSVQALATSELSWPNKAVILYNSRCDSRALSPLRSAGAQTASLLYHTKPEQFLMEGCPEALRRIRALTGDKPLLQMRSHEDYFRGMQIVTDDFFPLFASAMEAFRAAGMSRTEAAKTTAIMLADSTRNYMRVGSRVLRVVKPQLLRPER